MEALKLIFLHGFFASGACIPAQALKECMAGKALVLTPDLPLHPQEALAFIRRLCEQEQPDLVDTLFGSQKQGGSLIVSDGVFTPDTERSIRPRLRIDGATGSADFGGKFDVAQVNTGAKFSFTLTWLGMEQDSGELAAVEQILAALQEGIICLGAQKSNGFGRVKLLVRKYVYDMRQTKDRESWLSDQDCGQFLELPKVQDVRHVIFTVTGKADSILVKATAAQYSQEDDRMFTPNLCENGVPILPGSSIKGAVRNRAELIVRSTGHDETLIESLFGCGTDTRDQGIPGQVRFEDVRLDAGRKKKISRIRINRFTGGVIRGGLFQEEPLSSEIQFKVFAPADQPEGCALLLYALRDLGLGLYNLGSGGAIGRGYLRVQAITAETPGGKTAALNFTGDGGGTVSDPDEIFAEWMRSWKEGT